VPVDVSGRASALAAAARTATPISPLTETDPGITVDEAYAIQQEMVRGRLEAGDRVVGWKVGLTSAAMQRQLGVDQPDSAPVLESMVLPDDGLVELHALIEPRVESEIAFVLREALSGPGVTVEQVLAATEYVVPALEIIDSRIEGWRISLADTIADLASSAAVVLGTTRTRPGDVDLSLVETVLSMDGAAVASGRGDAIMGHPAEAVAWTANTLGLRGITLQPGHVVMSGAMHAAVPLRPGARFNARTGVLGEVSVRVTASGHGG
jgi:2-keto-4-pentenoate hydratase